MAAQNYKEEKLSRTEARKLSKKLINGFPESVIVSGHAEDEMKNDEMTIVDVVNVLRSTTARIIKEGELKNGSYRYQVETNNFVVVVSFGPSGKHLVIVTVWDKRNSR